MTTAFLIIVVVLIYSASSTHTIYIWLRSTFICMYIYLQSHLNVCLPEATIEKEKEDIIFYIYIYALNSCTHCKREEKACTHARTHLSYLCSRTKKWRNRSQALRYQLYSSAGQQTHGAIGQDHDFFHSKFLGLHTYT